MYCQYRQQECLDREISQIIRFFLTQNQTSLVFKSCCYTVQIMEKPSLAYHQGFLLPENSHKVIYLDQFRDFSSIVLVLWSKTFHEP